MYPCHGLQNGRIGDTKIDKGKEEKSSQVSVNFPSSGESVLFLIVRPFYGLDETLQSSGYHLNHNPANMVAKHGP